MSDVDSLAALYEIIVHDKRMRVQHVCLYMGLCYCWALNQYENPVPISRRMIMSFSKIKSIATYHKYMKELEKLGYIKYFPSYHPQFGSKVYFQKCRK